MDYPYYDNPQGDWSKHIESLDKNKVQEELMDTLHTMYPGMDIPEPTSILFHKWGSDPLTRGSYSNWPLGFLEEHHTNVRATIKERVWFTGEHCSRKYFVCTFHLPCAAPLPDYIVLGFA